MNIEIKLKNYQISLEEVSIPNYDTHFDQMRKSFENHIIDFSSLNVLKGDKKLLEQTFLNTKKEILEDGR